MRLIPKSMLARTAWVLGIGFILMIADGIFVTATLLNTESRNSSFFEILTRVKIITQLTANSSSDRREELLRDINDPLMNINWSSTKPDLSAINYDWATKKMNFHLMHFMQDLPVKQLLIGHPKTSAPIVNKENDLSIENSMEKERFVLTIQLNDNSWLQYSGKTLHKHQTFITNIIAIFVVFIVSIYLIALLISRQIIKPLRNFSTAAISFSVDINAAPLTESGPSEIIQAARAFNTMQERISHFVKERMQIIAAISHDLRTPLTRLRLRFDAMEKLPEYNKIMLDIDDMQTMLDSTLAFAKDDSRQEARSKVNLSSLLQTLCDDNSDTGGDIQCDLQQGVEYYCGPVAIKRAINNIVDNAQRYGHRAQLELTSDKKIITITVTDQGEGIPEDEQQKVLMPFYRIEKSRNKNTGGTGLGLTVAKTIISAHGGEISLQNTENAGLKVIISLPL